jgi:hypothetical protein
MMALTATDAMRLKRVAMGVAIAAAVGGYFYYDYSTTQAKKAKLEVNMAVSVLPPGTQEAWIAYVDRRAAAAVQPRAGAVALTGMFNGVLQKATLGSRNTPYQVRCGPIIGASVTFGYGDDSVMVPIYGGFSNREAEKAPPLGVIKSSVAAENLSRTLCERISVSLSRIMLP